MATILRSIGWGSWFPIFGRVTVFPQFRKICDVQKVDFPASILHLFYNIRYKYVVIRISFEFCRIVFWFLVFVTVSSFIPCAIPAISLYRLLSKYTFERMTKMGCVNLMRDDILLVLRSIQIDELICCHKYLCDCLRAYGNNLFL